MSFAPDIDLARLAAVEQFYYREARLLDERQYLQWLGLLSERITYRLPLRFVPLSVSGHGNREAIHAIDREISGYGPMESPIREENFAQLNQRAQRALKPTAWAENPPPRTRRFVANVEIEILPEGRILAYSNFQLFHSHHGASDHIYTGRRRDTLIDTTGGLKILEREILLDWTVITGPSLALFF